MKTFKEILVFTILLLFSTTTFTQSVSSVSGTVNQVTASPNTGAVVLTLPQDIHTDASPIFAGGTFNGNLTVTGNVSLSDSKFLYFNQKGRLGYFQSSSTSTLGAIRFDNLFGSLFPTAAVATELGAGTTFAPTSGTAIYNTFLFNPTINQTGGANGITRGLLIDPTITAAADFRAIEVTSGNVILGSSTGNVGIGTTSPSALLDISASSGASSTLRIKGYSDAFVPFLLSLGTQSYQDNFQIKMVNGFTSVGNSLNYGVGFNTNNSERMRIDNIGNVGIGTNAPKDKLTVNGNVRAKKVIVTQDDWPDYVFHPTYQLMPINKLAAYIKNNQHLPEIPSTTQVQESGINLGENQALLLRKIEELTLYVIDLKKENNTQQQLIEQLLKAIKK